MIDKLIHCECGTVTRQYRFGEDFYSKLKWCPNCGSVYLWFNETWRKSTPKKIRDLREDNGNT